MICFRLVSAFGEKFDKNWIQTDNVAMKDVRDAMLIRYRGISEQE